MRERVTNRQKIYALAAQTHGIITTKAATEIGVPAVELRKLTQRGALEHLSYGVYRVPFMNLSSESNAVEAIKSVDEDAVLIGESVLSLLDIGVFNPRKYEVSTSRRSRRSVSRNIAVRSNSAIKLSEVTEYGGVRCETVFSALNRISSSAISSRLIDAANTAKARGLLSQDEYRELSKNIRNRDTLARIA